MTPVAATNPTVFTLETWFRAASGWDTAVSYSRLNPAQISAHYSAGR